MFKILDGACTPKRGTKYSAYVDLFAREDVTIAAGKTKIVKLGIKLDMDFFESMFNPDKLDFKTAKVGGLYSDDELRIQKHQLHNFLKSHYLEIALRRSLGVKGLIIANGTGKVDLDYPDEIGIIIHNPVTEHTITWWIDRLAKLVGLHTNFNKDNIANYHIKKGDKVAQCTIAPHKGYLMGYETETLRTGGFGSTDNKEEAPNFDKPDFFKCNVVN